MSYGSLTAIRRFFYACVLRWNAQSCGNLDFIFDKSFFFINFVSYLMRMQKQIK